MPHESQPNDSSGLLVPRFSLRSFFVWITALCGLLAVLVSVPLGPAVVIAGVGMLLVAHIVGNALGTRLRDQGRGALQRSPEPPKDRPAAGAHSPLATASLQVTSLRRKQRLSSNVPWVAGSAALAGAMAGGLVLAWFNYPRGTLAGLLVGGLSCGFLGGFVGFLAGSFLEIFGPAWSEAASLAPDPPRRTRRAGAVVQPTPATEAAPVPSRGRLGWFARR